MAYTFQVDIVSEEGAIYSAKAISLYATTVLGELCIKVHHSQLLAQLLPGEVRIIGPDNHEEDLYVKSGFLEVQPHVVTILADSGKRATDIDEAAALEAKEAAERMLREKTGKIEYAKALSELAQASAQLKIVQKIRSRRGS